MADVFSVLRKDHAVVKQLLTRLEAGEVTGPTIDELVMAESRHEAAEEMYFWPAVRDKAEGGRELADHAVAQERKAKIILEDLRRAAPGTEQFAKLAAAFAGAAREHIAFEEERTWPALGHVLTAKDGLELGGRIELAKKIGPTRPHPHGPDGPVGLKTVGTAAAMMDKMADVLMRRGRS